MAHFGSFLVASAFSVPPAAFTAGRIFVPALAAAVVGDVLDGFLDGSGEPDVGKVAGLLRPVGVLIDETSLARACVNPSAFPEVPRAHNLPRMPELWLGFLGQAPNPAPPSELRM